MRDGMSLAGVGSLRHLNVLEEIDILDRWRENGTLL
jgi:hypothetical protein